MPRPRYRQLAHTADVRLAVWGGSEEELLRNAAAGALACALGGPARGAAQRWHPVDRLPRDLAARLVRVVNEALFLLYLRREAAVDVRLGRAGAEIAVATLAAGRTPAVEIKAATFHALEVTRGARLRAVITLDL